MKKEVNKFKYWKKLASHYKKMRKVQMRDLFDDDAKRADRFSIQLDALYYDYSKNRITDKTMKYLIRLAEECRLHEKMKKCLPASGLT